MSSEAEKRLAVQMVGNVADLRLNRAEKMNALDPAMFEGLVRMGGLLADDPTVRAVVLSGEGRGFCAGLDMGSFQAMGSGRRASGGNEGGVRSLFDRSGRSAGNLAQAAAYTWTELPVPVIAAVHGVAYGGGLQLALGADVRFVAPDSRLSVMEIKWGLIPDMSGTQTLRHVLRQDVLKELTYTGRVVSGTEAVELGLATHVSDSPHEAAMELAQEIASKSPNAVRAAKQLLNRAPLVGLEEGLALEEKLQGSLIGQPNQIEAVRANLEKRAPKFTDED